MVNFFNFFLTKNYKNKQEYLLRYLPTLLDNNLENKGTLGTALDGIITNNSYWKSTGITGQRGVCDMVTHTATELNLKFRFKSTTSKTTGVYFGVDKLTGDSNVLSREWNIIHLSGKLWLYIFSPGLPDDKIELLDVGYNNGEWHNIEVSWASNGVGLGGVFTVVADGVTKTATTAIDTMVFTGFPLTFNGRVNGASPLIPIDFDLDYFEVANTRFNFSSCWGDKIYSTDGSKFVQLYNQVYSTVWNQDDQATPNNFINGFYLYENGTAGEEIRYPIELENTLKVSDTYFASTNTTKWTINLKQLIGTNVVRFMFFSQSTALANGYCMFIESNGNIRLEKFVNWAVSTLAQSIEVSTLYSQDSTLVIERTVDGEFTISVNDVEIITITDTTFTTSGYFVTRVYSGSKVFIESILDESDEAYTLPYTAYPVYLDGYSLSGYYPPLVFGNMESGFKVPYNEEIAISDVNNKIYTIETPNEIKFEDLVTGGFGSKITYKGSEEAGFKDFCVKK